jgi:hypothetical protein
MQFAPLANWGRLSPEMKMLRTASWEQLDGVEAPAVNLHIHHDTRAYVSFRYVFSSQQNLNIVEVPSDSTVACTMLPKSIHLINE